MNEAVIQRYLEEHSPEEAEDAAGLIALLKSADHYGDGGPQGGIKAIIQEEAQAYFAGDRTVEECAELIQNRASIYLAEQDDIMKKTPTSRRCGAIPCCLLPPACWG